ncbi:MULTISPECIES: hypothetical protein [Lysinibacillus]|uniref:hypothetical protein n=1 Tax=Lysinibacillus TaxID=400634 RepID=UPI0006CA2642|nr:MULTISPECIES: hypothetical protein [Lysinibacillus]
MESGLYTQKEKNEARSKLIINAIESLTTRRKESMLLDEEYINKMLENFVGLINLYLEKKNEILPEDFCEILKNKSINFLNSKYHKKNKADLKVLYLSGPEPVNDLNILLENGISPSNIWAIEGDNQTYKKALQNLKNNSSYIKIHKGSLKDFFEFCPEHFDIVYYDACTPICSNEYNPLYVLEKLFANRRLTELSILITNFSEPNENTWDEWGKLLACWYTSRYEECPQSTHEEYSDVNYRLSDIEGYAQFISKRIPEYYSDFIRRFMSSLASEIVPFSKITSFKALSSKLFKENKYKDLLDEKIEVDKITKPEDLLKIIPHHILSPESYPLLNWVFLTQENLPVNHPMNKFLLENGKKILNSILVCTHLKSFEESYSGYNTLFKEIYSDQLLKVMNDIDFFDREIRLTLDIPMKNLIAELLIGQYAFPYISNADKHYSIKYKADGKKTWMYSDIFVFDQCRYLYDLLPSLELIEDYFKDSIDEQIIIRCFIDGILRNHVAYNRNFFEFGFIESLYDDKYGYSLLKERENLNI